MCQGATALADRLSTTANVSTTAEENNIAAIADDEDKEGRGGRQILVDEDGDKE